MAKLNITHDLKKKKSLYPQQSWYRGNIPQHDKSIYDKTKANIILNAEKLKAFTSRIETTHGCPLSTFTHHTFGSLNQNTEARIKGKKY